jgi:hypothetical protein
MPGDEFHGLEFLKMVQVALAWCVQFDSSGAFIA